jgi:hypothetical protein
VYVRAQQQQQCVWMLRLILPLMSLFSPLYYRLARQELQFSLPKAQYAHSRYVYQGSGQNHHEAKHSKTHQL